MSYLRQKGWWEGKMNEMKYGHKAGLVGKAIEDASKKQQFHSPARRLAPFDRGNYYPTEEEKRQSKERTKQFTIKLLKEQIDEYSRALSPLRSEDPAKQKEGLSQRAKDDLRTLNKTLEPAQTQYDKLESIGKKAGITGLVLVVIVGPVLGYHYKIGWHGLYYPGIWSLIIGFLLVVYTAICGSRSAQHKLVINEHGPRARGLAKDIEYFNKLEGVRLEKRVAAEIENKEQKIQSARKEIHELEGKHEAPEDEVAKALTKVTNVLEEFKEEQKSKSEKDQRLAELEAQIAEKEKDQKIKELEAKLAAMEAEEKDG